MLNYMLTLILQFKLIEISKSVTRMFKISFLHVKSALPIIGRVVLEGTAFDKSCNWVKRDFLLIENFLIKSNTAYKS